ncbi:MAG: DUF6290 family protein [Candidatus Ranarchaeia archaeon]
MTVISIRVAEDLKKKMEKMKHINWSEIVRKAIQEKIEQQGHKNIAKAVLINEEIRKSAPPEFDSTEIIRQWREKRK